VYAADADRRAERRWFGHGRTRALLSAGVLLGVGAVATSAYFTDRAQVTGTTINAGTLHVDLEANYRVRPETISNWGDLNLTGLTPGTNKAGLMTVSNNSRGQMPMSFRVQASATNALGAALTITVRRGGTISSGTCTGGTLIGSAGATLNGFNQSGGATLATGASTVLCIQATLPGSANLPASSTSNVELTFPAKQEP
jgi:predicted ribosomally synthesized peptide with SipW-like signal peptide